MSVKSRGIDIEAVKRSGGLVPLDELKPLLEDVLDEAGVKADAGIVCFLDQVYRKKWTSLPDEVEAGARFLYLQLRRLSAELLGKEGQKSSTSPGPALRQMGYNTRSTKPSLTVKEIEGGIASAITKEIVLKAYDGMLTTPLVQIFKDHSERSRRAYQTHIDINNGSRKKGKKRLRSFEKIINELHPHLQQQHKRPLYEAITNPRRLPRDKLSMRGLLRELFFSGEDLSRSGLMYNKRCNGSSLCHLMSSNAFNPSGELDFKKKPNLYSKNLMALLDFPHIETEDIIYDGKSGNNHLGLISEGLLHLMLQIVAKYDPSGEKMGEGFKSFFPDGVRQLYIKKKSKELKARPWHRGRVLEADARVISDSLDTLLEMKSHRAINKEQVTGIINKYHNINYWGDYNSIDGKISQKIIVLNCHNNGVEEQAARLEKAGWKVMMGDQFARFYERSLDLLLEKEPDFFRSVPYPITAPGQRSTPERYARHVKETLMGLHDLTYKNTHLLLRRGQRYFRTWAVNLLRESTSSLVNGERGEVIKDLPWKHVSLFKDFKDDYGGVKLNGKTKKVLFLDLETAGWKEWGVPIINLGLGYYDDEKEGMVTDVYMVRNPAEERKALEHFVKIASQYDQIVTYNGKTFDIPFLISRLISHRIDFDVQGMKHIDMYPIFRKVAQENSYPHQRLQSYEKFELKIASRKNDIPGKQIPLVYAKYLRDGQPGKVKDMIHHNQMDIVTLAVMYFDLHQEKDVKKK